MSNLSLFLNVVGQEWAHLQNVPVSSCVKVPFAVSFSVSLLSLVFREINTESVSVKLWRGIPLCGDKERN